MVTPARNGGEPPPVEAMVVFPQAYEVRVRGTLPPSLRSAFRPLESRSEADGTVTVISGLIRDQAELTGILNTLDSLGLRLLEVRPARAVTREG